MNFATILILAANKCNAKEALAAALIPEQDIVKRIVHVTLPHTPNPGRKLGCFACR